MLGTVAFFVFFLATAWARIITANSFQWVGDWFLGTMIAMWSMYVWLFIVVAMLVLAVRAVNVLCRRHINYSRM